MYLFVQYGVGVGQIRSRVRSIPLSRVMGKRFSTPILQKRRFNGLSIVNNYPLTYVMSYDTMGMKGGNMEEKIKKLEKSTEKARLVVKTVVLTYAYTAIGFLVAVGTLTLLNYRLVIEQVVISPIK